MAQASRLKKKWSERDTVKFVKLYEAEEVLWNDQLKNYKKKDARNAAYNRIMRYMNLDGFTNKDAVMYKINNIRSTYAQEKLKIKKSLETGSGADDVYVPSLIWFGIADRFLSTVMKSKKTSTLVNSDAELNIQENTEYIKDSPLPYIPVNLSTDVPASPSPDVTTPSLDSVQFVAPRHSTGKRVKRTHQRIDKSLETLESIKDQLLNNRVEDEFYYFGENVASQLRHLPVIDALDVQCEIIKLIAMKRRSTNNLNLPATVESNNVNDYQDDEMDDAIHTDDYGDEYVTDVSENPKTDTGRKRILILHSEIEGQHTKKSRYDFNDIIDYDNIAKFGEQILFLLKRFPRKLCRKLLDSIVTLIKTEQKQYESETKRDAIPSTSSNTKTIKTTMSQPILTSTLVKNTKHSEITIEVEREHEDKSVEEESIVNETTQLTQRIEKQLKTPPDQRFTSTIKPFPKPMTVPIVLVGSLDCVKQEVLDPGESSDFTAQEQYN